MKHRTPNRTSNFSGQWKIANLNYYQIDDNGKRSGPFNAKGTGKITQVGASNFYEIQDNSEVPQIRIAVVVPSYDYQGVARGFQLLTAGESSTVKPQHLSSDRQVFTPIKWDQHGNPVAMKTQYTSELKVDGVTVWRVGEATWEKA